MSIIIDTQLINKLKLKKKYACLFIDLFLQRNNQNFKIKKVFNTQKCALKNSKSALFLFLCLGENLLLLTLLRISHGI